MHYFTTVKALLGYFLSFRSLRRCHTPSRNSTAFRILRWHWATAATAATAHNRAIVKTLSVVFRTLNCLNMLMASFLSSKRYSFIWIKLEDGRRNNNINEMKREPLATASALPKLYTQMGAFEIDMQYQTRSNRDARAFSPIFIPQTILTTI